jgi:ribosomal protein S27AE
MSSALVICNGWKADLQRSSVVIDRTGDWEVRLSSFGRAWTYVATAALLLALFIAWNGPMIDASLMPLVIGFWALHVGLTTVLFKCPRCGLSVFATRGGFVLFRGYVPWPHRSCRRCGQNLQTP